MPATAKKVKFFCEHCQIEFSSAMALIAHGQRKHKVKAM